MQFQSQNHVTPRARSTISWRIQISFPQWVRNVQRKLLKSTVCGHEYDNKTHYLYARVNCHFYILGQVNWLLP